MNVKGQYMSIFAVIYNHTTFKTSFVGQKFKRLFFFFVLDGLACSDTICYGGLRQALNQLTVDTEVIAVTTRAMSPGQMSSFQKKTFK